MVAWHPGTYLASTATRLQTAHEIKTRSSIIPIPPVTQVPTYESDYLPLHSITLTYIKAPLDKREIFEHSYYEYDLDAEDCQFLHDVNQGTQDRLQPRQLEKMLWQLEVMNDAATQNYLQAAGTQSCLCQLSTTPQYHIDSSGTLLSCRGLPCAIRCVRCNRHVSLSVGHSSVVLDWPSHSTPANAISPTSLTSICVMRQHQLERWPRLSPWIHRTQTICKVSWSSVT